MTDFDKEGFITTVLREFSESFFEFMDEEDFCPQDCYDPIVEVLGDDFKPNDFHFISHSKIQELQNKYNKWFETDQVTIKQIEDAIRCIKYHWPES